MSQQPYDTPMKGMFKEDAEELIPIFLEGAIFTRTLDIEVLRPPMRTDSAYGMIYHERSAILQIEFQAGEDEDIVYRSLIYHASLLRDYKRPVISMIVYLFQSNSDQPPLRETIADEELLIYHYRLVELWKLDARKYIADHEISIYPLLAAMGHAHAELLQQAIDELVEHYNYDEAKLGRRLLWFSTFLQRTRMVTPREKQKVCERLETFEHLLETNEFVQKQRALGFSQGEEQATRQDLVLLVKKLYPSLTTLAEQRVAQVQKAEALRTVFGLILEAPDEATARAVLDSLLTA